MINILNKASNWKFILPLLILVIAFSVFVFPYYQSKLQSIHGSFQALDVRFAYTDEEVRADFEALGAGGCEIYRTVVGRIDMVYPIFYGSFLILLVANVIKKVAGPGSPRLLISLLPLAGVLFDYLENFNTLRLLRDFPDFSEGAVQWGELMTRAKHITGMTSVGLIIVFAILILIRRMRRGDR